MKYRPTLIEVVICAVIIIIVAAAVFEGKGGGTLASSYGRNLKMESMENQGLVKIWHWTDLNTGEHFYSYEANGDTIYKEEN